MNPKTETKGNAVKIQDIQKLVDMLDRSNLSEMELETAGMRLRLSKAAASNGSAPSPQVLYLSSPSVPAQAALPPVSAAAPPVASAAPPPPAEAPAEAPKASPAVSSRAVEVKSPMVGTFYRAPAPGADPFVKVGDTVRKGQTLCIIEAMKLMNEIESEVDGVILDIFPENAQPVEYGERLFLVEPA
ncbi:MAG: acetyl-CoA carboxylase biotin carboxyl carrier protein [Acidobacteriota bacterium]